MMNMKTTTILGSITRQGVSRQFIPLSSSSKNSVLTFSQRTAAQGGNVSANAPTNPVRTFSSSQANRDNNNNNNNTTATTVTGITGAHQFQSSHSLPFSSNYIGTSHVLPLSNSQRFSTSVTANVHFRKEFNNSSIPKYNQLSRDAWDAVNGHDAHSVFSYLQEMRHEGFYADKALSYRIISQFLELNRPRDAERALSMLVDCHRNQGRILSTAQKNIYTSLAKDIADHSSFDFSQALSLAKLLNKHGISATSGFADSALRTYRQLKASSGLDAIKTVVNSSDIDTLLTLQSFAKSSNRYKHLIEILLDAKEMNRFPSQEACSKVSLSFMKLNDYTGQLAWDTAVQEIYPGYRPTVPDDMTEDISNLGSSTSTSYTTSTTSSTSFYNNSNNTNSNSNSNYSKSKGFSSSTQSSRNDPSEAILRACRSGHATVALDEINKLISQNQLPSAQAIADTIQVCAKREKERNTDYQRLFLLAKQSLDMISDESARLAAEYEIYNAMLVANATLGDMVNAKKNYDDIIRMGQFPDATGYATLLIATTTGAVDEANDALRIHEEVKRHGIKPNIFFYNVVIGKLSRGRKIERVLEIYEEMKQHQIRPNAITYGTLISACTRVGSEDMAKNLFKEMVTATNYHARHGPHNAMIQFYVRQKKDRQSALHYYEDMLQRRLTPTEHTYTLLIEAFACIQPYDLKEANRLIQSLRRGPVRATESHYGALIHAYGVEHHDVDTAETVFKNMLNSGIVPKGPAYQSLIESFINNNQVSRAVSVREELLRSGQPSTAYIENTLIRGYGMEGNIQKAREIFEAMMDPHGNVSSGSSSSSSSSKGHIIKEPSTYQSMVNAYLENNMIEDAQITLQQMKYQKYPDLVVKPVEEAVLSAASSTAATNKL